MLLVVTQAESIYHKSAGRKGNSKTRRKFKRSGAEQEGIYQQGVMQCKPNAINASSKFSAICCLFSCNITRVGLVSDFAEGA